jgi:hypothetical protein
VVDLILDKGLVIDAFVRVSLLGIELLTIDARIVIASVDTYLRFAEAVERLDLSKTQSHTLPEIMEGTARSGAKGKAKGALEAAGEKVSEMAHSGRQEEREDSHHGNGNGEDSS